MKQKTVYVQVTYKFKIGYEHPDHLARIKADLKKTPVFEMGGAGRVDSSPEVYSYSCKRLGDALSVVDAPT